jgi:hypothetical protein
MPVVRCEPHPAPRRGGLPRMASGVLEKILRRICSEGNANGSYRVNVGCCANRYSAIMALWLLMIHFRRLKI